MTKPLAYLDGQFLEFTQMKIPVWDAGFVQGVTVAEQIRTFQGRLFRWDNHFDRLQDSLNIVGIDLGTGLDDLPRVAHQLISHNYPLLTPGDDLGLSVFVTPGAYGAFAPLGSHGPTLGVHTYPVAFGGFAAQYESGGRLIISRTRQIPESCWPPQLKCRSRMHYYLADHEASQREPGSRALLLDQTGHISEASTANFLLYRRGEGFLSPRKEKILPGISVAVLQELAEQNGEQFHFQDLEVDEIWKCDEAFLCSTSPCLLPVVSVDGRPIGSGKPGPLFQKMIDAWSRLVGIDIVEQAKKFAVR